MSQVWIELPRLRNFYRFGYRVGDAKRVRLVTPQRPNDLTDQEYMHYLFLNAANVAGADIRRNTIPVDQEHYARREPCYTAAALLVRRDAKIFAGVNTHFIRSARNCAEERGTAEAISIGWNEPIEEAISELIFMGGRSDPWASPRINIYPEELGTRAVPCGACLDVLARCGTKRITLLPLNHGNWGILPFRGNVDNLLPHEALSTTIEALLPEQIISETDHDGTLRANMRAGWQYITQESVLSALTHDVIEARTRTLSHYETPQKQLLAANALLMDVVRHHYHDSNRQMKDISVILMRTSDDEWHPGIAYSNGPTPNFHQAYENAIAHMRLSRSAGRVTDVASTFVNYEHLHHAPEWEAGSNVVYFPMPNGRSRERLKRCAAGQTRNMLGVTLEDGNAVIHEFGLNDPTRQSPFVIHRDLTALLPSPYDNPRRKSVKRQVAPHVPDGCPQCVARTKAHLLTCEAA